MPDPIDANETAALPAPDANDLPKTRLDVTGTGGDAPAFGPPVERGEVGTLGPYRVLKELGRGGMGAVYLATDTEMDRRLALKVMLPEFAAVPAARERFLREARAAALVTHDNVVTVFEADECDGTAYIAMQFLQGCSLDEYLKRSGPPPLAHAVRIVREAALGLAAAHEQGLVHRDIKPANLWLEAPRGRTKVLDFGLARPVGTESELTNTGAVVGTPAYMSPEQARGLKVDHRTDLFSLGSVLYRLCTGRNPFRGPTVMAVLMALGTEEPPPVRELNPDVPEALAGLIHRLLAKNPDDRPQTAAEVAEWLRAVLDGTHPANQLPVVVPMEVATRPDDVFAHLEDEDDPDETQAETVPNGPKPGGMGKGPLVALAAVILLAAGAVAVAVVSQTNRSKTEPPPEVAAPVPGTTAVEPKVAPPVADKGKVEAKANLDPDRAAALWAIDLGARVRVNGEAPAITTAVGLPRDRFALTEINLDGAAVTDAGLEQLKDLKDLSILSLIGTKVGDAGLVHLKELTNLTNLRLDRTAVTDAGLERVAERKGLLYLRLNGTQVSDAGMAHLKKLQNLRELQLGAAAVGDEGLEHLAELKTLTHFHLESTRVTDAGLKHLKGLNELKALNLERTAVGDVGLPHLVELKNLTSLYLNGAQVSDTGLAHVGRMRGLKEVQLSGTKVTARGLAALAAALPQCKIVPGPKK